MSPLHLVAPLCLQSPTSSSSLTRLKAKMGQIPPPSSCWLGLMPTSPCFPLPSLSTCEIGRCVTVALSLGASSALVCRAHMAGSACFSMQKHTGDAATLFAALIQESCTPAPTLIVLQATAQLMLPAPCSCRLRHSPHKCMPIACGMPAADHECASHADQDQVGRSPWRFW